jgi:hypothetical protein
MKEETARKWIDLERCLPEGAMEAMKQSHKGEWCTQFCGAKFFFKKLEQAKREYPEL